jgi:hypothetical protein
LARGYRKSGVRLWTHLTHSREPATAQTVEQLLDLLRRADFEPPAQLLHWLLVGPWAARFKLVARLGREANDPIDELLNAAMAYATGQVPSLVGFLQWFDSGDGELKREAGQAADLVRVMTVHGSKGLQAPIVILADAADDPDASLARGVELVEQGPGQRPRTVPLPALRKEEKGGPVRAAEEQAAREERAEHWRLLYVALTRAEEALFIAGAWPPSRKELPVDSWYARLAPLFGEDAAWEPDPIWDGARSIGMPGPVVKTAPRGGDRGPAAAAAWLTTPIGPEPRPPRPLAPSALGEDEAPDPPTRPGPGALEAARRGTLIHKLIERLPAVPLTSAKPLRSPGWRGRRRIRCRCPGRDAARGACRARSSRLAGGVRPRLARRSAAGRRGGRPRGFRHDRPPADHARAGADRGFQDGAAPARQPGRGAAGLSAPDGRLCRRAGRDPPRSLGRGRLALYPCAAPDRRAGRCPGAAPAGAGIALQGMASAKLLPRPVAKRGANPRYRLN